ncbi:sulfite exporter TauE/SafE family protein [uncultured Thermanaerothrix sp.]|uniref:sulfite exporter TauE/SafE family protein n=1 Tax=uncultured Thermanaerothrix sp. TaxID=1195149 RepID=UPI00260B0A74|nr:sulfite exporter TauE/SafE family protein [uncultured Thermanaerothrix sp.]
MIEGSTLLIALAFFVAALLYASVGHGGASAYLAVMGLLGIAPAVMRPTALILNLLVASVGAYQYIRAGRFSWRVFWPFALTSVPLAYLGGRVHLPAHYFEPLLGIALLFAALRLWVRKEDSTETLRPFVLGWALGIGAVLGFVSGLIGIGGGIFLSPLLIFLRWAETRQVSGIAAAFIIVNSVSGFLGLLQSHPPLPQALPLWALAVLVGGWIGADLGSRRLNLPWIRRALGAVLVVAALRVLAV